MTVHEQLVTRSLFGGAMTIALPARFQDISDFRPVPDHQEVFADGATDQSLIVEIAERIEAADADVGKVVFEDIASVNDAVNSSITSVQTLENHPKVPGLAEVPGCSISLVAGQQSVAKARESQQAANQVLVVVAVLRLPQRDTDLLLSMNAPTLVSEHSSSAQQTGPGSQPGAGTAQVLFMDVLKTFRIHDWTLFTP